MDCDIPNYTSNTNNYYCFSMLYKYKMRKSCRKYFNYNQYENCFTRVLSTTNKL